MNATTPSLNGLRIVVTRPEGQADTLIEQLETLGATVLHAPTIRIADPPSYSVLNAALRHLRSYDWIVWTSANGVARTFARLDTLGLAADLPQACNLAVIGSSTANPALVSYGLVADLVAPRAVAESLRGRTDRGRQRQLISCCRNQSPRATCWRPGCVRRVRWSMSRPL